MDQDLEIRRRRIRSQDLLLIRRLIEEEGAQGRSHLSNRLCELWDWRQANGRYRQIACRDLLRQLEVRRLIKLPPRLSAARRPGYRNKILGDCLISQAPVRGALGELRSRLSLRLTGDSKEAALFRQLVGTYHYLGYHQPTGAQLKYIAYLEDRPIACLSFGPAAWKSAPRDQFIGWSDQARRSHLARLVNNDRFVILPWVQIRSLASFLLAALLRRLRRDWQTIYNQDLALAETFVEKRRFAGGAYAAANWICVGETLGRGRNDRAHLRRAPLKTIWLYPLRRDFRPWLCQQP